MARMDIFQLRKAIPLEEFDYSLLCSAFSGYSGPRQKINRLLKSGVIVRVKKGLYVFGPDYNQSPICKEVLANLIYGPSCLSLEYALSYHGLILERVETLTSVTPKRDKEFNTPLGRFTYRYLGIEKYPHGIEQVLIEPGPKSLTWDPPSARGTKGHSVLMASPEKALCDYLVLNKIPIFTETKEVERFLASDLRIDPGSWKRLRPDVFKKLNEFYRNKNIARLQEAL